MSRGFSVPSAPETGPPVAPTFIQATLDGAGRLVMYFTLDLLAELTVIPSHQFILQYDGPGFTGHSRANITEDTALEQYASAQVAPAGNPRTVVVNIPYEEVSPGVPLPWDQCFNFLLNYNRTAPGHPDHPTLDIFATNMVRLENFTSANVTYRMTAGGP